ncbi:UNKNOWN [Stylonychia lemnae]|uniref:Secreted protein n=1 Tax=Stylonychia lemnae TaxID=5949 RepID=A0A078AB83_STYLE|nr:UNKNOWN [Stylonychia lemnae]|eukprot:CDW78038.1 UNKNOWN [Stylonychia lemnae]
MQILTTLFLLLSLTFTIQATKVNLLLNSKAKTEDKIQQYNTVLVLASKRICVVTDPKNMFYGSSCGFEVEIQQADGKMIVKRCILTTNAMCQTPTACEKHRYVSLNDPCWKTV